MTNSGLSEIIPASNTSLEEGGAVLLQGSPESQQREPIVVGFGRNSPTNTPLSTDHPSQDSYPPTEMPGMVEDHEDDTKDSGYDIEDSDGDSTSELTEDHYKTVVENNRRYPADCSCRKGLYWTPIDKAEQDRLTLQHQILLSLQGHLFLAPITKHPTKILNVFTTTGLWAMEAADMYPDARVVGIDDAGMVKNKVTAAKNCDLQHGVIEGPWTFQKNIFDFIYCRDATNIRDWSGFLKQFFIHTKPGGWAEIAFIDPLTRNADESGSQSALQIFTNRLIEAGEKVGIPSDTAARLTDYFQEAGFTKIVCRKFFLPSADWPENEFFKQIGKLQAKNILQAASGLVLRKFEVGLGLSQWEIATQLFDLHQQLEHKTFYDYNLIYVVYGQKPLEKAEFQGASKEMSL